MSDDIEWIKGRKARSLLIQAGLHPAEIQLRQALRIGKVHGRALHAAIEGRGRHRGQKVEHADWDVPAEAWKGGPENSRFDLDLDVYSSGDYENKLGLVKLTGLSFVKSELIDYFEIEDAPVATTPTPDVMEKGKGGRAPKVDEWNNAIAALIVYAQSGKGIDLADQPGAIYKKALDYAATLGLEGEGISIDRCKQGILSAKKLIAKAEGTDENGNYRSA